MTRALLLVTTWLVLASTAHAKPPPAHAPPRGPRPAPPLPMLPSIARVRIEAARDRVIVTEEVNLPRGDWRGGSADMYVAFGSPGTPSAVDARLVPVPAGAAESRAEDAGEPLAVEPAIRRPVSAQTLLGRPQMAGVVVRIKDAELRRALEAGDLAALRIRSLLAPPTPDAGGAREVVVRLGAPGGLPITLSRIQVVSLEPQSWITRAEARLCGPEAETLPLSVSLVPKPADAPPTTYPLPIAPPMAVRHASDDLCLRWWAQT